MLKKAENVTSVAFIFEDICITKLGESKEQISFCFLPCGIDNCFCWRVDLPVKDVDLGVLIVFAVFLGQRSSLLQGQQINHVAVLNRLCKKSYAIFNAAEDYGNP